MNTIAMTDETVIDEAIAATATRRIGTELETTMMIRTMMMSEGGATMTGTGIDRG